MVALKINWDIFKYCLAQCLAYDKHATDKAKGTKESHILFSQWHENAQSF